jgi:hypothetical protein
VASSAITYDAVGAEVGAPDSTVGNNVGKAVGGRVFVRRVGYRVGIGFIGGRVGVCVRAAVGSWLGIPVGVRAVGA